MKNRIKESTTVGTNLAEVKIQIALFPGDVLSPFIFVIVIIPLNPVLRKCKVVYKFTKLQEKFNYLMCMDDIQLFAIYEKEWRTLKPKIRICR